MDMLAGALPRGAGCPLLFKRVGSDALAAPRSERAREAAHGRASWEGERGLRSVPSISVGIRTLGEELSGPARRRRGRRDGWFLLVAYRHASTQPSHGHFTALYDR